MATTLGNGTITFGDGTTLSTASMINSIQRGTFTPSIAVSGGVFNISAVTTAKCMVIIQGDGSYSLGPNGGRNNYFTTFTSTTQFAWSSYGAAYYYFGWQVIEFK